MGCLFVKSKWVFSLVALVAFLLIWWLVALLMLPRPLFHDPFATVVYSHENRLLGARIAKDGQWRFPVGDTVSEKFKQAVLVFEDGYFYQHPGFNPISIGKAMWENLRAGKVVRGGSTITQQVIRLSRKGQPRTFVEKIIEMTYAIALETYMSKEEILSLFANYAPMGGNVVGVKAAAWRYFGHPANVLSWAEAATLAVLPNAPSLINPGKNRHMLFSKRNRLLGRLFKSGLIDTNTLVAAKSEPLPNKPYALPNEASHVVAYCLNNFQGQQIIVNIDFNLQQRVNDIVEQYHQQFSENNIHNAAVLVVSVPDNKVVAYLGNTLPTVGSHQNSVDIIRSKRSTGSILKPILYAAMQEEGLLLPHTLVADIPSYYNDYHPTNFDNHYMGSVPASKALARSLNVPAVFMLRDYGQSRFLNLLHQLGVVSFNKPAKHYGLSMILGGGEASLWELTGVYAGMARTVLNYDTYYGSYNRNEYFHPLLMQGGKQPTDGNATTNRVPLHAGSIWLTYQALEQVNRPESEAGWEQFSSSKNIAWKTGTSFGFRDAWAIGSTADYVVGVWVGNADGVGRTGLTGSSCAAPIMFSVFQQLALPHVFHPPFDEMLAVEVCAQSGYLAGQYCPDKDTVEVFMEGAKSAVCPYHKRIYTTKNQSERLNLLGAKQEEMVPYDCFELPPVQEWYYRQSHPTYRGMPPWRKDCMPVGNSDLMKFIYPQPGMNVFLPDKGGGRQSKLVIKLSHRLPRNKVYWHLDKKFVGMTEQIHEMALQPLPGTHVIAVVDETGAKAQVLFRVSE